MSQSPKAGEQPPPEITFGDLVRVGWRKLREMRSVFQLLVLIAIGALLCTVIPQKEPVEAYFERYGTFLGNIIVRLGLDHVHTSAWFLVLLGLLLLSLVACSGRLWREGLMRWRLPEADAAAARATGAGAVKALTALGPTEAAAKLDGALRRHGYRTAALGDGGSPRVVVAYRHRFSAWGQTLAHYAVFAIALGAVMGSIPGLSLDETREIAEGHEYAGEQGDLPFAIHVDRFYINHDPASGSVQNYYSEVRLLAGGQEVARGTISVNHPLRYHGYFISQSSWGLAAAVVQVTVGGKTETLALPLERVACPGMDGPVSVWGVRQDEPAVFTADGHTAVVGGGFYADARRDKGEVHGSDSEYPGQPAIQLTVVGRLPRKEKPAGPAAGMPPHTMQELGWLLAGETRPIEGGEVTFVGLTKTTGLGLRKDVGLPLVWVGFIASMVGLALIFYFPLQRWVLAVAADGSGRTAVSLASYGRASELSEDQPALWADLLAAVGGTADERSQAETRAKQSGPSGKGAARG